MSKEDPTVARFPPALRQGRFHVDPKEWDSKFFDRPIGLLTWSGGPRSFQECEADQPELDELCVAVDEAGYSLTECQVDLSDFAMVACIETAGFRLVDSRIRFLTRWNLRDVEPFEPRWGRIRAATVEDRDRIIELTHEGFTLNDQFVSRFKNPEYFSDVDTRRYYEAWIDSTAFADDAATAVFETDRGVVGYFIYQIRSPHEGLPVVKSVLTAVAPESRGAGGHLAMQSFLYGRLGLAECYVENVTQLTNTAVIRNHMSAGKQLEQVALTLFRARS